MNRVTDGIVAPAQPATPKPVRDRLAALTEFFRGRPMDPARAQSMRGKIVAGISAVGVAAVIAGGATGCASKQDDLTYGYPLEEQTTTTQPAQVVGVDQLGHRYERWAEESNGPGALLLGDAQGGDGYEVNWYEDGLNAPLPIDPAVMYANAPSGTEFETDVYGNPYPVDPNVQAALTATEFQITTVELQRPEGERCVEVDYTLANGNQGLAGTFLVDPSGPEGRRVQSTADNQRCPQGPSKTVTADVQQLGPGR